MTQLQMHAVRKAQSLAHMEARTAQRAMSHTEQGAAWYTATQTKRGKHSDEKKPAPHPHAPIL